MTENRPSRTDGFTLIELLVVVLIIGILVAIAVPKFLGAQTGAKQRAAQSNLRAAESLASTIYTNSGGQWTTVAATLQTSLQAADASLTWQLAASTKPAEISYVAGTGALAGHVLGLAVRSTNGDCYYTVIDNRSAGAGTKYAKTSAASSCVASVAPTGLTNPLSGDRSVGWA